MNCPWVKSQITLYLYNELDDPDRIELEQHLDHCADCAAEVSRERRLHKVLDKRPAPALDPNLLASCRMQLAEALDRQPQPGRYWWRFWSELGRLRPSFQPTLAALVLLLGFVAGWALSSNRDRLPIVNALNAPSDFSTANIANIQAIKSDPSGNLEITYDTTRQRVLRGRPEDPQVEQLLVYAARNLSNPGIRLDSIEVLKNRASDQEIKAALISAVKTDRNAGVRLKALEALKGLSADAGVKAALLDVMRTDDNPGVRIEAINQLSKLADPSTVPLLQDLATRDPNSYIRLRSADTLRQLKAPEIF